MTTSDVIVSSPVVSNILEEQHMRNRNNLRFCLEFKREIIIAQVYQQNGASSKPITMVVTVVVVVASFCFGDPFLE